MTNDTTRGYNKAVNTVKPKSKASAATQEKNYAPLYRILIVLALDICAISSITYIKKDFQRELSFRAAFPIIAAVFGALLAASIVWLAVGAVKKVRFDRLAVSPSLCTGIFAVAGVTLTAMYEYVNRINLIIIIIAASLLYFVYKIYSKPVFIFSAFAAVSVIGLIGGASMTVGLPVRVASMVLAAAAAVIALIARKNGGKIGSMKLLDDGLNFWAVIAVAGILLVGSALIFVASAARIYAIFALLALYLIITIINTIKMI